MEEGGKIEIMYNPDDPSEIEAAGKGFGIYLLGMGALLVAAAAWMFIKM